MTVEFYYDVEQGSKLWFELRRGIPTASCFADILAKGEGKMRRRYMMDLLGERLTGEPVESFSNKHTERGHLLEPEARELYSFLKNAEPVQVGFARSGDIGASPDSLIGNDGLLEIKTKLPRLQAEVLLANILPPEHKAQVQGQLMVCEREWTDFVSYWPKMRPFIHREYRDEKYIKNLQTEIGKFLEELAVLEQKLK